MVNAMQIKRGLANFVDNEVLNKIPGGTLKKTLIGTFTGMYLNNINKMFSNVSTSPFVAALGIIDENGNVDIDTLMEEINKNVPEDGLKIDIDVLGFHLGDMRFHKRDLEQLKTYIVNSYGG